MLDGQCLTRLCLSLSIPSANMPLTYYNSIKQPSLFFLLVFHSEMLEYVQ